MHDRNDSATDRRRFLRQLALGAALWNVRGAFAQQLTMTPAQTEGPFYPATLPLDTDNDLLVINDAITPAVGDITYLSGRVLTPSGDPVRDAHVEIWQSDQAGAYIHPQSTGFNNRDRNFQGFGRFLTGSSGEYLFRTIKPGLYPGRTRHIHVKVKQTGRPEFITQVYVEGEPQNATDGVLNGIRDPQQRAAVIVPFSPIQGSTVGALAARFDIVLLAGTLGGLGIGITNATDSTRNPVFRSGDSWALQVSGAPSGAPVFLHIWRDNRDLGISGPYGGTVLADGTWRFNGSFSASDRGAWQIQAVLGSPASTTASRVMSLSIE